MTGIFRYILEDSDVFWKIQMYSGRFRCILEDSDVSWKIQMYSGRFRCILEEKGESWKEQFRVSLEVEEETEMANNVCVGFFCELCGVTGRGRVFRLCLPHSLRQKAAYGRRAEQSGRPMSWIAPLPCLCVYTEPCIPGLRFTQTFLILHVLQRMPFENMMCPIVAYILFTNVYPTCILADTHSPLFGIFSVVFIPTRYSSPCIPNPCILYNVFSYHVLFTMYFQTISSSQCIHIHQLGHVPLTLHIV